MIAVLSERDAVRGGAESLAAAVKEAAAHGADVVELRSGDARTLGPGLTSAAGLELIVATDSLEEARWAAGNGAVAVHWTGGADGPIGGALGAIPVMSVDDHVTRGDGWLVVALVVDGVVVDGPGDRVGDRPVIADLDGEFDPARIAALTTVAMAHGAWAIRTVAPQSARRAAYVVRAVEGAP